MYGPRRVVVTGIGLVTCLGTGTDLVWKNVIQGKCGIVALTGEEFSKVPSRVAGLVKHGYDPGGFNLSKINLKIDLKSASTSSLYALVAANEAIQQAKLDLSDEYTQRRTGVAIGMSMIGLDEIVATSERFKIGYNKVSPHFVPKILTNMPAGLISIQYKIKGLNHSVATACTTGLHSLGDAFRFIRNGDVDAIVCGSTESCVGPLALAGFCRMRALSTNFNSDPLTASRPFDDLRDGFVMSEGACIMVMESLGSARRRGIKPICEVLGYGLSSDANHITAPCPHGEGAEMCMLAALRDANIQPGAIGYVNAHATSTSLGDAAEAEAIYRIFAGADSKAHNAICNNVIDTIPYENYSDIKYQQQMTAIKGPAVSSTKGALGHMLGAAGSTEVALAALACNKGVIPPSINLYSTSSIDVALDFVRNKCRDWSRSGEIRSKRRVALSNSFGFGGTNASLCVAEFLE
ncbi:hypothetical protein HELRODRAFT_185244 [Helobdella robusta]|uniref:3-oxoacyl-[acyl-carrier-protein] synthase n=1 Tax=Helobdella robusta TaxID=6412 RepID=T1FMJ8_HELRO|nr:hypothetical protein HELRODRAFT_185244 [Helobdella robusta]ESO11691.1 hypothetical protein HELRODRAFT_185244 [Helobdella robusta]